MSFNFSERVDGLSGTATREIFKLLSKPEVISFAGGLPANEFLPTEDISRISNEILSMGQGKTCLQYGATEGFNDLRKELIKYVEGVGINNIDVDNTLVVSGGQQGIDLMCKAFLDKDDVVLVENPTYLAILQIVKSYQGKAVGVKSSKEGIDLDDLENKIIQCKPKLIYLVPTFSNPTGKTYSVANRKSIASLASKYNVMVIEDDPYSKLRFSGEKMPALKTFDNTGNVVYVTSFSKILSPGLRVGVTIGDSEILRKLTILKQGTDVHTSNLSQLIALKYLQEGLLNPNIEKALPLYNKRKQAMVNALNSYMPSEFKFVDPDGGLFVWGEIEANVNTVEMFKEAIERNVAYVQGQVFYANSGGLNTLRLNFSNESEERIDCGIKTLSTLIKKKITECKKNG